MRVLTVLVLSAVATAAAWTVTTGDVTLTEADVAPVRPQAAPTVLSDYELLVNGGFESGSLDPWQTSAWVVGTFKTHSGDYCAADLGNYYIEQAFTPTPGSEITGATLWMRQPERAISWVGFYYDDGSENHTIAYPDSAWTLVDLIGLIDPGKTVVRLRVWGYSGGGPGPDSTYIDDASVMSSGTGVAEPATPVDADGLSVLPNPVASGPVKVRFALPKRGTARVTVLGVNGQTVVSRSLQVARSGEVSLDLRSLGAGVYLIRVEADGFTGTQKLVIQH